jgi:hypothetical protein
MENFTTTALSSLRSRKQLDLLDEIDALSRAGIGEHISLPQIVVCGDQSSGKSSCLEAISGVSFPHKDTLCTRFATELVLRKSDEEYTVVNIVPSSKRPEEGKFNKDLYCSELTRDGKIILVDYNLPDSGTVTST